MRYLTGCSQRARRPAPACPYAPIYLERMQEDKLTDKDFPPLESSPQGERDIEDAYGGYIRRKRIVMIALVIVVCGLAVWSMGIGSLDLSPVDVIAGIFGQSTSQVNAVVQNMRLPRILTAVIAGIALALAGCAYQSTLRNPLASASTLGIAQGAAFGASIAIIVISGGGIENSVSYEGVTNADPISTAICAFLGAMLSTVIILALSRFREMSPESIVLLGVALSALFTAGTTMVQYFAEDSQVAAVVFWTFGDLSRVTKPQIILMAIITALSTVFFFLNRWNYNAIESGEALAHGLGVPVSRVRLASMVVASAAASTVIAFCGIINFVGLVAPHIMRRLLGADYRYLLPASALAGAGLLLASDMLCHVIVEPLILPISAITSFVGAPIFIYLLFRGVSR